MTYAVTMRNRWGKCPYRFDHDDLVPARSHLAKLVRGYRRMTECRVTRERRTQFLVTTKDGVFIRLGLEH